MISVDEAHQNVGRWSRALPSRRIAIADALHLRLAADVASQVDSPPFDKSAVDGFAVATSDKTPTLHVTEMVVAGAVPKGEVAPGTTIRVMTGAPLPRGADAVVKWEDCQELDDATIANPAWQIEPGSCVLKRGAAFRTGQVVLSAGKRLGPLDVALLAEIGQAEVPVTPRPRVGVLPTGDELVAAHEPLGPSQIRNSNGPMLLSALVAAGAEPVDLGVARDDPVDLRQKIERGLQCDILLVSGGVSAGVKDLAPGVLAELGVQEQFHKVRMKPGKPLWFGSRLAGSRTTLVFGLPGNPVSTFVSFKLFVEPALAALAGATFAAPTTKRGALTAAFKHRGGRPTYHPCRVVVEGDGPPGVEPLAWGGSADLATLTRADALAAFPSGDYELEPGTAVDWMGL